MSRISDLAQRLEALVPEEDPGEADALAREHEGIRAHARAFLGLPDDVTLEEIQAAFGRSLWDFWTFFFEHYRRDDAGHETEAAPYQPDFCEAIQDLVVDGEPGEELARAYPREHAKSVFGTLVGPLWATASGHRRFAFLFSDTDTQAWGFLEDIRVEVETNERLQAIYPDFCSWRAQPRVNRLVFGDGAIIMAAGSGKSVRGARKGAQRPDFIVLDDIENDEEVENPKRRRKKMTWYNKVVRKLGRAAVYLIVGTILHAESFLAQRVKSEADIFAAVVRDAERQDLWQQWEEILRDRTLPDREGEAWRFYQANRAEMDRGAVVLWPAKFTLYQLYKERAEDLASYLSERQNRPFDPTAAWFPEDRLLFLEADDIPLESDVVLSIAFWDPSRGTSKSDTSALPRLDVYRDGRRIVTEGIAARIPPEEVMDVAIGWHRRRPFNAFGVEKVGLSSYDEQLRARAEAAGVRLPIEPVTPTGDKHLRIRSLRPDVVAQTLAFAASLPLEVIQQLKYYPQHPNDDFWDAVQQAMTLADVYTADVPAAGGTVDHDPSWDNDMAVAAFGRPRFFAPADAPRSSLEERQGLLERAWS